MKKIYRLLRILNHPLNRANKTTALARYIRWQIGARLLPAECALPFVNDTHLFAVRSMFGATGNWYCGLDEMEDMAFVLHALRPGDLFLDVGTNIGSYTVLAAGAVGANVIAVEPVPSTFNSLRFNVRLNNIDHRVNCLNIGLGETEGELRFTAGRDCTNHVLTPGETGESVLVQVKSLDNVCSERTPAVIKIDVEGYEQAVISGGKRTLANDQLHAVIMETNGCGQRYGWDDGSLIEKMRNFGFLTFSYDPFTRRIRPAQPETGPGTGNTLFIRNIEAVQERVAQAPRFHLVNGEI